MLHTCRPVQAGSIPLYEGGKLVSTHHARLVVLGLQAILHARGHKVHASYGCMAANLQCRELKSCNAHAPDSQAAWLSHDGLHL